MYSKDKEYVAFIADHPEYHNASLQVERRIEQAEGQFEATDENRMLFTLQVFKEEGSSTAGSDTPYYEEIEKLTDAMKEPARPFHVIRPAALQISHPSGTFFELFALLLRKRIDLFHILQI